MGAFRNFAASLLGAALVAIAMLWPASAQAQEDVLQEIAREITSLPPLRMSRPLRYVDGAEGAALRRALDPRRAPAAVSTYVAARERRDPAADLMAVLGFVLGAYENAFTTDPRSYQDEYLDALEWRVQMQLQGWAAGGLPLTASHALAAERKLRGQVEQNLVVDAARASELANALQRNALARFPELRTRPVLAGREVYAKACAECHTSGAVNAPRLGDRAAWNPRLRGRPLEMLVRGTLNGKCIMPPQFGPPHFLLETEIARAVAYMGSSAGFHFPERDMPAAHSGLVTLPPPPPPPPPKVPYAQQTPQQRLLAGEMVYAAQCAVCHQPDGRGAGPIPDLRQAASLRAPVAVVDSLLKGSRIKPPYQFLEDDELAALVNFMGARFLSTPPEPVTPADVRARRR